MQLLKIGGETYTLQFGFAACKLLQEITRKPFMVVAGGVVAGVIDHLADSLYCATRLNHGDLTRDQCRKFVEEDGYMAAAFLALKAELSAFLDVDSTKTPTEAPQKKVSGSTRKAK